MNDFKNVLIGDLIYVSSRGLVAWIIKKLTRGNITHVAIVYNPTTLFETTATKGRARFAPLNRYRKGKVSIRRLKTMTASHRSKIMSLCHQYDGAPYSFFDILLNAIASFMPDKLRRKFVSGLGNKTFIRCGELIRRIIFEAVGYEPYRDFEASNPSEMFQEGERSDDFLTIL